MQVMNTCRTKIKGSRMRKPRIAILGATGVVGREITKITDELGVEFESIKFLSSAKSAGTSSNFRIKNIL